MTCTARTVRVLQTPEDIVVDVPAGDGTLLEMTRLQHDVFDDPEPADERTVARLRGSLSRGGRALIGRDVATRQVIAAAQSGVPAGGATEVVGVVVAPAYRRRDGVRARAPGTRRRARDGVPGGGTGSRRRLPKRGIPADVDERAHIVGA